MAVTVNAGSSATFGIDAAASLTITNSGRDAVGVITFTSAAPDSGVPSFTAPIQEKVWGPFLAPMQVTIAVTNGTCSYQPNGNTGGFGYDTSGNITGLVDGAGNVFPLSNDAEIASILDQEIYPYATTGNGNMVSGLEIFSEIAFQFIGADATNTFQLLAGGVGLSSAQTAISLTPIGGGSAVTTVVAAGMYTMTVPALVGDVRVTRSGAGSASCAVVAVGRVTRTTSQTKMIEIYPAATSGSGVFYDSLHDIRDWSFHVSGADADNVFAINVGNVGDSASQTVAQVQDLAGGSAVTSIVAPGVYKLTKSMPFRDIYVTRSGVGVASCQVIATGKI